MAESDRAAVLIDRIYAALVGEIGWDLFLREVATCLPNGKAVLFFHDIDSGGGAFSLNTGFSADAVAAYGSHFSRVNPWMRAAAQRPVGLAVRAEEMLPRPDLLRTEFYADYLQPYGLGTAVGVTVYKEERCNFMLSVLGAEADDATVDSARALLGQLAPHLRRVFVYYRRSPQAGAVLQDGLSVLDLLGIGLILVAPDRRVRHCNQAAEVLIAAGGAVGQDGEGCLRFSSPEVTVALDRALGTIRLGLSRGLLDTQLLRRDGDRAPLRVRFVQLDPASVQVFFAGAAAMVLIEDPAISSAAARIESARAAYGLTAAELRVARRLIEGLTPTEIAAVDGVSPLTVRSQLKSIFAKTDTRRQAEVVRKLSAGVL
ncbi:helix-turn-helix transcriptional regulator [Inquilinus sp. OTU3971]|uniref:helix-turn-helix transcriptional regulator n=1 Tax=Inquilinus sp. OTU3971 TaxID=3043855 RepID=UPI00313E4E69